MVTEAREVHPSKALSPIDITESGTVIEVRAVHVWNALSSIEVTESGIVYEVPTLPIGYLISAVFDLLNRTSSSELNDGLFSLTVIFVRYIQLENA